MVPMTYFGRFLLITSFWFSGFLFAQQTLPYFATIDHDDQVYQLNLPADQQKVQPETTGFRFLILTLDPSWQPDWQKAAFLLKTQVVAFKTAGRNVLVGLQASGTQVNELINQEFAPYVDGYIFTDEPSIPNGDATAKLWQRTESSETEVLTTLVEASSLGIQLVLFENLEISQQHRDFLNAVRQAGTGSLDIQPEIRNLPQSQAQFFFQPETGKYHLGLYNEKNTESFVYFSLAEGLTLTCLFPEGTEFIHRQFGKRTELGLPGTSKFYFFEMTPANPDRNTESLSIVEKSAIDPYELVVRNQVFKDREDQKFESLKVDELLTYRYQTPDGSAFEVSWDDTLFIRKDKPVERIRNDFYFGGARWREGKVPELPLLEPEKVQTKPMIVDFDKTYIYEYQGEDTVDGHTTWKVGFKPKVPGNFSRGTVWIDQENGAHRKIRALQSNLEPPVVGNEVTAYFDWVEDGGVRYWTQVRETGLQVLNLVGERIPLQVDAKRSEFQFNRDAIDETLSQAYASDKVILRDTPKGFRYMKKKGDKRVLTESTFLKQRALLGGIFVDPALDTPIPLAGLNYVNLDFLGKGLQANFFIAGAINDVIISQPDFLGKGWDLTAELFASALYFEESIYDGDQEVEEENVERLRESLNLSLGIPVTNFFKVTGNYSLAYVDYKSADETAEDFVTPSTHFENIFRLSTNYDRKRFSSELSLEQVNRSEWEAWGRPGNTESLQDKYTKLSLDTSFTKPLGTFQSMHGSLGYLRGWDMDRFARASLLNGAVSGINDESIQATEAIRAEISYDKGINELFQFTFRLNGARTWLETTDINGVRDENDPVDLFGVAVSANFFGPWRTLMRINVGYGLHSDIPGVEGDFSAQIVFLRLF